MTIYQKKTARTLKCESALRLARAKLLEESTDGGTIELLRTGLAAMAKEAGVGGVAADMACMIEYVIFPGRGTARDLRSVGFDPGKAPPGTLYGQITHSVFDGYANDTDSDSFIDDMYDGVELLCDRWPDLVVRPNNPNLYMFVVVLPEMYEPERVRVPSRRGPDVVSDEELDDVFDGIDETEGRRALRPNKPYVRVTDEFERRFLAMADAAGVDPSFAKELPDGFKLVEEDTITAKLALENIQDWLRDHCGFDPDEAPYWTIYGRFPYNSISFDTLRIGRPMAYIQGAYRKLKKKWPKLVSTSGCDYIIVAAPPPPAAGTVSDEEALAALDGIDEAEGRRAKRLDESPDGVRTEFMQRFAAMADAAGVKQSCVDAMTRMFQAVGDGSDSSAERQTAEYVKTRLGDRCGFDPAKAPPGTLYGRITYDDVDYFMTSAALNDLDEAYRDLKTRWPDLVASTASDYVIVAAPPLQQGGTVSDEELDDVFDGID